MNPNIVTALLFALAILVLVVWLFVLERRIKKLLGGKDGASLEDAINENRHTLDELQGFRAAVESELVELDKRIKKKIHGAKTIRFNPFQGTGSGGNQSFATSLLDEDRNGVVLSSLYTREKVSIYAKPIENGKCEFELTAEEREVLK